MKITTKIAEMRKETGKIRRAKETIGFVPTMGYLHEGHLSLVRKSIEECDKTVVSIFVNPTQFAPSEDYNTYPRDTGKDIGLLSREGVALLFMPSVEEMYGRSPLTNIGVSQLSEKLEGRLRPGHFKGVCTVVCKLFNIVSPDRAYFGQKDAQQLVIIKRMVNDLNIPVEISGCPTVREKDGLAASSRNVYIPPENREKAVLLYRALSRIKMLAERDGIEDIPTLLEEGKKAIEGCPEVELQYLEIVDMEDLSALNKIEEKALVLGAVKISGVRLIDNMTISLK